MATQIDFMGRRRVAVVLSACLVVISLIALLIAGLNGGLEFTGGTLVELRFPAPVSADMVRDDLAAAGIADAVVQMSGTEQDVVVRLPARAESRDARQVDALVEGLAARHPGLAMQRADFFGPAVGDELTQSGFLAVLTALAVTGVYIMWRFTGKFALGAGIALLHDTIITVGVFAVSRLTFDLPALAAVLAVIGYSLNDTIVICDRIRENLRILRKPSLIEVINRSLNQTLGRTVICSLTTLLTVLALLVFGGPQLRGFSVALTVGIVVGTYSSIYIAAAFLVYSGLSRDDLLTPEPEGGEQSPAGRRSRYRPLGLGAAQD